MGRKRTISDPVRVTLLLINEDYEYMKRAYPTAGAAVAIRALVHQHVNSLKKVARNTEHLIADMDLEIEIV